MPQLDSQNLTREMLLRGSRPYTRRIALSAGGADLVDPDRTSPEGRWLSAGFDKLKVANQSNADVVIQLGSNPSRELYVEAGTQEIFDQIQPFRSYKVINMNGSTSISSNELTIQHSKQPLNADEVARRKYVQNNEGLDAQTLVSVGSSLLG